jgi:hypothetical protein
MTQSWLEERASELGEGAYLFVEGYEFTGLAVWRNGGFHFPVEFSWRLSECEDLRLFADRGEWHCWRASTGWNMRWKEAADWKKEDRVERRHVLRGRKVREAGNGWWTLFEAAGAAISVPFEVTEDIARRPLRLVIWHRLEDDPVTGQRFIKDAMLRAIVQTEEE